MKKHRKCKKIIIAFVTVLFIAFVAVIGATQNRDLSF